MRIRIEFEDGTKGTFEEIRALQEGIWCNLIPEGHTRKITKQNPIKIYEED